MRELDGDAEAVGVRPQAAEVVRELVRQHRRDESRNVGREGARRGAAVERRARGDEVRDVGDVDVRALVVDRERVVEVLGGLGVDRERRQLAEVDAAVERDARRRVRLEVLARAGLDEQRLEHVLDPVGRAEHRAPRARGRACGARRRGRRGRRRRAPCGRAGAASRREVRLADDELPAPRHLDDDRFGPGPLRRHAVSDTVTEMCRDVHRCFAPISAESRARDDVRSGQGRGPKRHSSVSDTEASAWDKAA